MAEAAPAVRPASTMLLLRDGQDGMEVFMVVRHHQIDFASGALVFPGGSLDPDDHVVAAQTGLIHHTDELDPLALAFRVGALRETFEECGILLARLKGSTAFISAKHAQLIEEKHRAALCEGEIKFSEILANNGLVLALDTLVPFAHWITPVGMPKRFDTMFFMARAPENQLGAHDGHESVDSVWVTPQQALDDTKTGRFKLVFATERNLLKLGENRAVDAALDTARKGKMITVTPEIIPGEGKKRQLRIPLEAGYGGEVFDLT